MKPSPRLFVTAFLLLIAPAALGWSALGHRLVGELAQRHLTPAARAQIAELLAGEPDPSLAGVATWADTLRDSDPQRFKQTRPGITSTSSRVAATTGPSATVPAATA